MDYKLSQQKGALNEVEATRFEPMPQSAMRMSSNIGPDYASAHQTAVDAPMRMVAPPVRAHVHRGAWFTTIDEGDRVLASYRDGRTEVLVGPKRVWNGGVRLRPMIHHVAHPGEFLIVRRTDGGQKHLHGPVDLWEDPREHGSIEKEDVLRLDNKEAVVVYAKDEGGAVTRRIVHGPASFVPEPGEWLHTFSWHGSRWNGVRYHKVPNALVFQKLWLMPDQMYHDVPDVRTADDALLTVRLMVFFELVDIERMLESTHDPIGDFVNAATSDVIDWVGRYEFDAFKRNTEQLNDLAAYKQLLSRAGQCGYRIHKVVYRGYGATEALQRMHDEAIESRTRLQLERATEQQAQELEDAKIERELARTARRREEASAQVGHEIETAHRRQAAELSDATTRLAFQRAERERDARQEIEVAAVRDAGQREHLEALARAGVDLTRLLTAGRPDQVLEVRGGGVPHVHLAPSTRG